ncbi:hypothetical protein FALBO_3843 [Fusarium albosuccineum]|uniref:Uncharacterized protein n=1 Tax=Fusarium albosuccineum TaxID=1237068 RepID=A0A8H4PFM4_9HYPO|nr:hypothetical protein FALBO_3843 [Fusarium albosuccineum]
MQLSTTLGLAALLHAATAQNIVGFGPAFSLGPTKSWIRESTTTLVLPKVPNPPKDRLALWPGMGTSGGDLIQALAVAFSNPNGECGAKAGQWCTWASTLQGEQLGGKQVPADAGTKLTIHYKYNDSTGKYDQTVAVGGSIISTLSTSSGHAEGWGTAVECQDDACVGTVAAHQYLDTTIILNEADKTLINTLGLNEADSSGLTTSDGGKTWHVSTINIHSHTFNIKS